jgi:RNA polymerase sigma-70 factor (ECF subfamily)
MVRPTGESMPPIAENNKAAEAAVLLFERVRSGDHEAFDELYHSNRKRVLSAVKRYIPEPDTAEYVANGVFMRVWQKRNGPSAYKGDSTFSTWITRVALNEALMYLRGLKPERAHAAYSLDEPLGGEGRLSPSLADFPVRDLYLDGVPDRKDLDEAMAQLRPTERQMIQLRLIDGMSTEETCQILHMKTMAVKARLLRTRRTLQRILNARKLARQFHG